MPLDTAGSRRAWLLRLMAPKELVDRSGWRHITMQREVGLQRRAVRADAVNAVGERVVNVLAILDEEAIVHGEPAGVGRQVGVGERHRDEGAGLGDPSVDAAINRRGAVLDARLSRSSWNFG